MSKRFIISGIWLWLSALNALLVTVTSLFGILSPATYIQETDNWATQAVGQDIANLVSVPVLLLSTYLLAKGSFRAYLVWIGVYFYLIYAFVIYSLNVHFNFLFPAYVTILGLSIYTPAGSLFNGNLLSLPKFFSTKINVKPASALLMIIGVMFSLLWLSEIIPDLLSGIKPPSLTVTGLRTNPVHVLDLGILLPAMIITSISLWMRGILGYFLAVPLLVFSAIMGIGIIVLFILLAEQGNEAVAPPAYFIGVIVLLSIYLAYRFLENIDS